jgi:hypothetical protein
LLRVEEQKTSPSQQSRVRLKLELRFPRRSRRLGVACGVSRRTERIINSAFRRGAADDARPASFPQILQIGLDPMLFQEQQEFILKRYFAMMAFLILDILDHRVQRRLADRKRGIATLPLEEAIPLLMPPMRRVRFDIANDVGDGMLGRISQNDMEMIGHASNRMNEAFSLLQNASEVREKVSFPGILDQGFAILGAEDDVSDKLGVCSTHRRLLRSERLLWDIACSCI